MNTTRQHVDRPQYTGGMIAPGNVHMAASLNRLQVGGVTKSRCGSFVAYALNNIKKNTILKKYKIVGNVSNNYGWDT